MPTVAEWAEVRLHFAGHALATSDPGSEGTGGSSGGEALFDGADCGVLAVFGCFVVLLVHVGLFLGGGYSNEINLDSQVFLVIVIRMGRPKKDRCGRNLTIYLTPERLEMLGADPAAAIYRLIDRSENIDNGPILEAGLPGKSLAVGRGSSPQSAVEVVRVPTRLPAGVSSMKWTCSVAGCGRKMLNGEPACLRCKGKRP